MPYDDAIRDLYARLDDLSKTLAGETALIRRDHERDITRLEDRIGVLEVNKRFVLHAAKGAGTADATLTRILTLLEEVRPALLLSELRNLKVNKTGMADAIQLGVDRGVLVRGVLANGGKGQRPQVVTLTAYEPRIRNGPAGAPIIWEDDPAPPPTLKRRPPKPKPTTRLTAVVNPETGRYNVTERPAVNGKTYGKCRHFPDGLGPCQDDCLAIFGSVITDDEPTL